MNPAAYKKLDTFAILCHAACAVATGALAVGSWYVAPWVFGTWRQSLEDRTASVTALIDQKPQIRAQHAAALEKCSAAEAALARLQGRIPQRLDTSEFYRLVSRVAAEHTVELGDVRPQDHRGLGIFDRHKWRMSARGQFLDVCRFMKAVEELPIQCYVDDIVVNAGPAEDKHMMAELGIVSFSQKPPTTPPPAPAPAVAAANQGS